MKRKVRLDVVMKSGAVVRLHVTDYTIQRDGTGRVTEFKWESTVRHGRCPLAISVPSIDAVVRV